jgi:hypothetical protein
MERVGRGDNYRLGNLWVTKRACVTLFLQQKLLVTNYFRISDDCAISPRGHKAFLGHLDAVAVKGGWKKAQRDSL